MQFAQGLAYGENMNWWSPWQSNALLQNLNNNAEVPTLEGVRKALADYRNNAENLQSYMEFCNVFDMLFARTVKSYVNALSFDLNIVCTNAKKSDYQSDEYIADKMKVNDFLNKFDYKAEFRKVVEQVMLHEVYFTWFRKTKWGNKGMKYALQIMPQDRCLLTGYWDKGLLYDFDMTYFLQAGVDIDGFDPAFKKYYQRVFVDNSGMDQYRPTNQFDVRKGTYAMWTQTSPADGAWAFKFNTANFNTTPFLAPYLKNALTNDEIQQLQLDKDIAEAYAILAGEIATFDSAKSGTKADQMVFNPKTLGQFMAKAKSGLSKTVKLAALPVGNLKWYQYQDSNKDMYDTQLSTSAGVGTGISRVIYSSDRMSNAEVEAALNEVYQTVKPLYYQFSNFLEFYVNQITKKFNFRFVLDGSTYKYERQMRFDNMMKMADKGMVLSPSYYASTMGIEPQLFDAMLEESKGSGWVDNLQLLMNANTASDKVDAGRPMADADDLSESGEQNRDA